MGPRSSNNAHAIPLTMLYYRSLSGPLRALVLKFPLPCRWFSRSSGAIDGNGAKVGIPRHQETHIYGLIKSSASIYTYTII